MASEVKLAVRYAWLICSAICLTAAVVPLFAHAEAIGALLPPCEARLRGASCFLCGMTSAFFRISNGELGEAQLLNAGSVPLYVAFCVNGAAAALQVIRKCKS